jgi:hypothetical protein
MVTFRKVVAIGVFLFGTMFLWRTSAFNGGARSVKGMIWKVIQALVAVIGLAVVAWASSRPPGGGSRSPSPRPSSGWLG